ncbi:hypothetical protein Dimus_014058 [Dionaea muscipula]
MYSLISPRAAIVFFFSVTTLIHFSECNGRIFTLEMHHRYSDQVKLLSPRTARLRDGWPAKGTFEYYAELAERDRFFQRRCRSCKISEFEEPVTFSDGNATFRISSLGFLHYATVTLGTPGMKFLVALDTGSDLFWVPCDCASCAPIQGTTYGSDFELSIYNPKDSSTSKKVSCDDTLCFYRNRCSGTFSHCPYLISYVSAETSTSGILVEDVLHLGTEDHHPELVKAYITFGCGQVQTGSFLDVAAPNGLFGLGMEKISVPTILSREGFISDSFSMCFGLDGVGRISFGDIGSIDQQETPFNVNPLHPTYNITVTQIQVGTAIVNLNFTALYDTGTSFTYFVDPAYTKLSENFHSQARDRRLAFDSRIPFEYCYEMSDANTSLIPSISLTMGGGSRFTVYDPVIVISTQSELIYCLAVVKSTELNIIGQNFMTGYHIVFDREKLTLGWQKSDCYNLKIQSASSVDHNSTSRPPAVAVQPGKIVPPHSAEVTRSPPHNSSASPFTHIDSRGITVSLSFAILFTLLPLL